VADRTIAVVGGDGIGPEVAGEAVKALRAGADRAGVSLELVDYDLGGQRYLATGQVLPDRVREELRAVDAILLGAVGHPDVAPGVLERGLLLALRFDFDQYVNLRPVRLLPGVTSPVAGLSPGDCDLVVVRENTEGLYAGAAGTSHHGTSAEVATETSVNTRYGAERVARFAAELAAGRSGTLTLCHKTNVLTHAGGLWQRAVADVAAELGVATGYTHVDAMCLQLVQDPARFDVVVTDNLFGDIVTDLGAAVQGGLGFAASGNLNPTGAAPSMFEPVHGSAPDIAGTGRASPVAAVLSAAMLLDHLGHAEAARAVEQAAAGVSPLLGPDQPATAELGDRIAAAVAGADPRA
jgi:3-isopropylmalate dehydrogenase